MRIQKSFQKNIGKVKTGVNIRERRKIWKYSKAKIERVRPNQRGSIRTMKQKP